MVNCCGIFFYFFFGDVVDWDVILNFFIEFDWIFDWNLF